MDKNQNIDSIFDEVRGLEYGDTFKTAATKTEDLLSKIRAIPDSATRHGFICNYLSMVVSLDRRVRLGDHVVVKRA